MTPVSRIGAWILAAALAVANAMLAFTDIDITITKSPVHTGPIESPNWTRLEPVAAGSELGDLSSVVERPLFWASRRPYPAQSEPSATPPAPAASRAKLDELKLTGVMRHNTRKRALISWHERPEGVWLDEGATHAGWRIASIDEAEVRIEADGYIHRLLLRAP